MNPWLIQTLLHHCFQTLFRITLDTCILQITGRKWQIPGSELFFISHPCKRDSSWDFFPLDFGFNWRFILLCVHCYNYRHCEDGDLSTQANE